MTPAPPWRDEPRSVYAILDAAPSAVVGVDASGTIDYVNSNALAIFDHRAEELLGQPIELLLPAGSPVLAVHEATTYADLPTAQVLGVDEPTEGRRRDGSVVPVEVRITALATELGPWFLHAVVDASTRREREQRMEGLSRAYLTLARINQAIVRAGTPQELFEETCRVAVEQGGFLAAWVGVPTPDGFVGTEARAGVLDDYIDELRITLDPDDERGQGPTGRALRSGHPAYAADYLADATTRLWHEAGDRAGVKGSATLPLLRGGRIVAALTLYADDVHFFDEQMRELLEGMARNVSFALDACDARDRLESVAAQRSELLRRLIRAQEQERARIAADVHDDSVQSLAAVDLRLGLLLGSARASAPHLEPDILQLQEIVADVATGLRGLLFDLEPLPPGATLTQLLRDVAAHALEDVATTWSVTEPGGPVPVLPHEMATPLIRIAQEALVNVVKHARARTVRIQVVAEDEGVTLRIADDGVGLGPDDLGRRPGHRGVTTMADRAAAVGGRCRVTGSGAGTTVEAWVPDATPPTVIV